MANMAIHGKEIPHCGVPVLFLTYGALLNWAMSPGPRFFSWVNPSTNLHENVLMYIFWCVDYEYGCWHCQLSSSRPQKSMKILNLLDHRNQPTHQIGWYPIHSQYNSAHETVVEGKIVIKIAVYMQFTYIIFRTFLALDEAECYLKIVFSFAKGKKLEFYIFPLSPF